MRSKWQTTTLGDVADIGAGNAAPQDEALFKGGTFPFFRTADAGRVRFGEIYEATDCLNDAGVKGLRRFPKGTILFPKSGASTFLNHRVMLGVEGCVSSHLATIVAHETKVSHKFLLYFLSTIEAQDLVQDHAYPSLNLPTISGINLKLPTLPEQKRIVASLDEAFDGIATARINAERSLQSTRGLFEAHIQSILTGSERNWTRKSVSELVTEGILQKPFDGNHGDIHPKKADYKATGVPFIMASDLVNGRVDTTRCKYISRSLADSLRVGFARNGDVLISHKGTIGRTAVVETAHEYIMLTPQVTAYRVTEPNKLLNKFVYYYFRSPGFQRDIRVAAEDGATRAYVGITRQLTLSFRYPSVDEQRKIVSRLDAIEPETRRLEDVYLRKISALDELKGTLLHEAFAGRL